MCSEALNYKSYQQVISLGPRKKTTPKPKNDLVATKRRAKSGCLTCRRRKKKCDEEKVGGKCQACIRNFLDCCWADELTETSKPSTAPPQTPVCQPAKVKAQTPLSQPVSNGASAYPSPAMSPKSETELSKTDIQSLILPPSQFKVSKPKQNKKPAKKELEAKFYIASFDSGKALCQVKN